MMAEGNRGGARSFARMRGNRIVEVHIRRLSDVDDVAALKEQVAAAIRRAGVGAVICADHRFATPLSGEVADAWSRIMRTNDGQVVLRGLLLDPFNAMYNLQLERVVRCADNPARRLFFDINQLRDWVRETLTESEHDALRELFSDA